VFEAMGRVVYVGPGWGMGMAFESIAADQQVRPERWLVFPDTEL
jgi:hypothetical protein